MNDEKRTSERVPVNLPTRWHGATGSHEGRAEGPQRHWLFGEHHERGRRRRIVSLLIQLPSGRWLPIRGKVAFHQQLTGFSISFSILDEKERETLNELVAQQSQTL